MEPKHLFMSYAIKGFLITGEYDKKPITYLYKLIEETIMWEWETFLEYFGIGHGKFTVKCDAEIGSSVRTKNG